MRPIVIVLILVALVLAGGAAFLVNMLLQRESEPVEAVEQAQTEIMVAARDLPAGELLADSDLAWRAWPDSGVQSDYIVRSGDGGYGDIPGSGVRSAIRAGEPITAARVFKRTDAGFLAGVLGEGMRAIAIEVDETTASGGFVLPGDRVDVLMTQKFTEFDPQTEQTSDRHVVQTVLEDVRVIAVDQSINDVEEAAVKAKTVTIEVTPAQGEIVALAGEMGNLTLALRSLSRENREARMSRAEKKAGGLPAALTVPMILFFLPVLFIVLIGPAVIQVIRTFQS
jgi:pilus assembly protein CpaB